MRHLFPFAAALVLVTAAIACGERSTSDDVRTNEVGPAARDDSRVGTSGADATGQQARMFVEEMAHAGIAEVELGRLASQRGGSADVKQFGQMMMDEHTKANNELKQVALQLNIAVPNETDAKHKELAERLSKMNGAQFDREYSDAMVMGHQEVVSKLEAQSRVDAGPTALKQWAANALPTVEKHLERAKDIQEKLGTAERSANR
jgi:putative membrane protein